MDATRLEGWTPVRLRWQDAQPVLDWCFVGAERFTEPFFDQTVQRLLRHPFNQLFRRQTPLAALAELHAHAPGLAPTGFIFHMSLRLDAYLADARGAAAEYRHLRSGAH
jgi:hypothetical protein